MKFSAEACLKSFKSVNSNLNLFLLIQVKHHFLKAMMFADDLVLLDSTEGYFQHILNRFASKSVLQKLRH